MGHAFCWGAEVGHLSLNRPHRTSPQVRSITVIRIGVSWLDRDAWRAALGCSWPRARPWLVQG
jgi:hypothetical protein